MEIKKDDPCGSFVLRSYFNDIWLYIFEKNVKNKNMALCSI